MPPLVPGTLISGRYRISGNLGRTPYGDVYRARDAVMNIDVAFRRVRPELVAAVNVRESLAAEIARACSLDHPNIVKPLDFINDDTQVAVISQLVDGKTLRSLITARGGRFTVRDAYGIISQLCAALSYASGMTYHGGICASNIVVADNGHVRLTEFGLARAVPLALEALDPHDRAALAPEYPAADSRSDLFALGAVLFELVTGKGYVKGLLPRNLKPNLPTDIDAIATCLLSPVPEERFADAETLRQALTKVVESLPAPTTSKQQQAVAAPAPSLPPTKRASTQRPAIQAHAPAPAPAPTKTKKKKVQIDHHEARWLVHKGKLDYGPYTLAELKDKIEKDEVVPGDLIIDQELGHRAEAEAHPLLHDMVLEHAQKRDDVRRAHVEAHVVSGDRRRGLALYGFIAAGAAVLVTGSIVGFRYLQNAGSESRQKAVATVEAADLGGLKIGGAKRTDDRDAQRRHRGTTGRTASPAAGKAGDAFDDALSFDMVGAEVGDERLDDSQINGVLTRHGGQLGRCLQAEANRGGARNADIDFIVLGSGKVSQVRVNGETGSALASCVRGTMASMQFPAFNGPRTKASFPMSL